MFVCLFLPFSWAVSVAYGGSQDKDDFIKNVSLWFLGIGFPKETSLYDLWLQNLHLDIPSSRPTPLRTHTHTHTHTHTRGSGEGVAGS